MTALAIGQYSSLSSGLRSFGQSEEATAIRRSLLSVLTTTKNTESGVAPALNELIAILERGRIERDPQNESLCEKTFIAAKTFLFSIPMSFPVPEVSLDPDGEVSFDWFGHHNKIFSVSLRQDGRLSYAGVFGPRDKVHGTAEFVDAIPTSVLTFIGEAAK